MIRGIAPTEFVRLFRMRLTIQKKFLLLILLVGLTPAAAGVLIVAFGGGHVFTLALNGPLQNRVTEIASRLDAEAERQHRDLLAITQQSTDFEEKARDALTLDGVDYVARFRSTDDFTIRSRRDANLELIDRIRSHAEYFGQMLNTQNIYSDGRFDDLPLENERAPSGVTPYLIEAYPAPDDSLFIYFVSPEALLRRIRFRHEGETDGVMIYSPKGHILASHGVPFALAESSRRMFGNLPTNASGPLSLRYKESERTRWHLVAFSVSRRLARLAAEGSAQNPWTVMLAYDMENFLAPQATLVWAVIGVSLIWALLLTAISIASTTGIVGPIKLLRRQAESMASGDLSVRAKVKTRDELQDLAEAFNTLSKRLLESHDKITKFNQELEQKVEERTADLAKANQKLVQTEKHAATGRLAANLAHEINNPLGIIKNYLRMVSTAIERSGGGRRATDPNIDHVRIISEELDRIARIVRQLLDLHRPVEQSVSLTDINTLIRDTLAIIEKSYAKENIVTQTELDSDLPTVMVSPDLIKQVLINLFQNAHDAMEGKGGTLTIKSGLRTQWENGRYEKVIHISVTDTGCGIPKENLDHIFDAFFTTKSSDKGTGLGLSVSYGIVRMYRGSIEAQSDPGKGTTMLVTIPVEQSTRETTPDEGVEANRKLKPYDPTESTEIPILGAK